MKSVVPKQLENVEGNIVTAITIATTTFKCNYGFFPLNFQVFGVHRSICFLYCIFGGGRGVFALRPFTFWIYFTLTEKCGHYNAMINHLTQTTYFKLLMRSFTFLALSYIPNMSKSLETNVKIPSLEIAQSFIGNRMKFYFPQ